LNATGAGEAGRLVSIRLALRTIECSFAELIAI